MEHSSTGASLTKSVVWITAAFSFVCGRPKRFWSGDVTAQRGGSIPIAPSPDDVFVLGGERYVEQPGSSNFVSVKQGNAMLRAIIRSFAVAVAATVTAAVFAAGIPGAPNPAPIHIPHPAVPPPIQPAPGECAALVQFDAIAASVTLNFFDRTFRGLPWTQLVKQFRRNIRCTDGPDRIATVANALFAKLKASHTGVYAADDLNYWALESIFSRSIDDYPVAYTGIWPVRRGDQWFARYVLQGSPAERAGVLQGDELVSIDGKPYRPLGFRADASATLIVSEDGITRRALHVRSSVQSMQRFFLVATRDSDRIEQVNGRAVGYFHLWTGTNPLFLTSLDSALSNFKLHHVAAVILDLRGGYGGGSEHSLQRRHGGPAAQEGRGPSPSRRRPRASRSVRLMRTIFGPSAVSIVM